MHIIKGTNQNKQQKSLCLCVGLNFSGVLPLFVTLNQNDANSMKLNSHIDITTNLLNITSDKRS